MTEKWVRWSPSLLASSSHCSELSPCLPPYCSNNEDINSNLSSGGGVFFFLFEAAVKREAYSMHGKVWYIFISTVKMARPTIPTLWSGTLCWVRKNHKKRLGRVRGYARMTSRWEARSPSWYRLHYLTSTSDPQGQLSMSINLRIRWYPVRSGLNCTYRLLMVVGMAWLGCLESEWSANSFKPNHKKIVLVLVQPVSVISIPGVRRVGSTQATMLERMKNGDFTPTPSSVPMSSSSSSGPSANATHIPTMPHTTKFGA